jgi:hypothetical protein
VGGTVIGLGASATVNVLNNGADTVTISANGSFSFPTEVASGGAYSVTVETPSSSQTCGVQNGSGNVASAAVTNVLVYCTYVVTAASLKATSTYTGVGALFYDESNGVNYPFDIVGTDTYDGVSASSFTYTINYAGTIASGQSSTGTYTVTTTDAIPSLVDGSGSLGGVEGANDDAMVEAGGMASGSYPSIYVGVLPNTSATTDSVNGTWAQVALIAKSGDVVAEEGTTVFTNGNATYSRTSNNAGTLGTDSGSFSYTVTSGIFTVSGASAGAVSADGDLIIAADTTSGDAPSIFAGVLQGSGVTQATFDGVYAVASYGGNTTTATTGGFYTIFAYGNGSFGMTYTQNNNGTVASSTGSGTYTVTADGTLTITLADGTVLNGAISADGNALVLADITSGDAPLISVGVRQ